MAQWHGGSTIAGYPLVRKAGGDNWIPKFNGNLIENSGIYDDGENIILEKLIAQESIKSNKIADIGKNNNISGNYSLVQGEDNIIEGDHSHVEGYRNAVYGNKLHAEGQYTLATISDVIEDILSYNGEAKTITLNSVSEFSVNDEVIIKVINNVAIVDKIVSIDAVNKTLTLETHNPSIAWTHVILKTNLSDSAHAEGNNTIALGRYSHAEGNESFAFGLASHSEGTKTKATGDYSHSEGEQTEASGIASHAEGFKTKSSGNYSHSEGTETIASGENSHAEGHDSIASGHASHAEGEQTEASGDFSHSEGGETVASGDYSHAEGYNTEAEGNYSHAEGYRTEASGLASHAGGRGTVAAGDDQTAIGRYNVVDTLKLFIIGNGTDDNNRSNAFAVNANGELDLTELAIRRIDRELESYSMVRSNKDSEDIFTTIEWKTSDNKLVKKSVLSGGSSPTYTTRTVTYYAEDGSTVISTKIYSLQYDADGNLISETVS